MTKAKAQYVVDPNPNAPRHHDLKMVITVPSYGKPSDDIKTAQSIKQILQTGLHSRVQVRINTHDGRLLDIEDRDWKIIE